MGGELLSAEQCSGARSACCAAGFNKQTLAERLASVETRQGPLRSCMFQPLAELGTQLIHIQ